MRILKELEKSLIILFKEDMKKNPDFLYNMVEVEGIKNCWCWGNSINRSFALVNIIKNCKINIQKLNSIFLSLPKFRFGQADFQEIPRR